MIRHLVMTSFRYLFKSKWFTAINITGLSVSIAVFILIALYLQGELDFDKHVPEAHRIYRLVGLQKPEGINMQHVAYTSGAWAEIGKNIFQEVEDAFRIMERPGLVIEIEEQLFNEPLIYWSEGNMLKWLNYGILDGINPGQMLSQPNQAVISRNAALHMYDRVEVVGESFVVEGIPYLISGVVNTENIKTHHEFNVLLSLSTVEHEMSALRALGNNSLTTYFVLHPKASHNDLEEKINEYYSRWGESTSWSNAFEIDFYLQPIQDIYLRSGHLKFQMANKLGNINNIYLFSIVAILILIMACINYVTLSIALTSVRSKEVGLRKVLGATPNKLIIQFMIESLLVTIIAVILALMLTEIFLLEFNMLLSREYNIDFVGNSLFNIWLLGLIFLLALFSGFYPAFLLSRLQPSAVLKTTGHSTKHRSSTIRITLLAIQFIISSALILSTFIVLHQYFFMRSADKGFNSDKVGYFHLNRALECEMKQNLKSSIVSLSGVQNAAFASSFSGVAGRQSVAVVGDADETRIMVRYGYVDPDFFPTMEIGFVEGRNFNQDYRIDLYQSVIINEAAANTLGWKGAIKKQFVNTDYPDLGFDYHTVIGVVKDYNFYRLHSPIEPALFIFDPGLLRTLNIRLISAKDQEVISMIRDEFQTLFPGSFFEFRFLDEVIKLQYQDESNLAKLFLGFSFLFIFISCIGLFGLTLFVIDQRKKEIGIRKVFGSSVLHIIIILVKQFAAWVLMASCIAIPITILFMDNWLANFAFAISISWYHISVSVLLVLLIAIATIIPLAIKAAKEKPIKTIQSD